MTSIEPHINAESKLPTEITQSILDSRYIFNAWLTAFILLLLTLIFNPYLNEVKYPITAAILFIYLWCILLAKLDQLAISLGIKSNVVYKALIIPVIGTIVCYRNIMPLAIKHTKGSKIGDDKLAQ